MKQLSILMVLPLMLVLAGCSHALKDPNDYFPVLGAVSQERQPDGSVTVKVHIDSYGATDLHDVGFVIDTLPNAETTNQNQAPADRILDQDFFITYKGLSTASTFYVRPFITNGYGMAWGKESVLSDYGLDTTTLDCHPALNRIDIGTGSSETAYTTSSFSDFSIYFNSNHYSAEFEFPHRPVSGTYTCIGGTPSEPYTVSAEIGVSSGYGMEIHRLETGSKVYVYEESNESILIFVCSAPFNGHFFTAKLRVTN